MFFILMHCKELSKGEGGGGVNPSSLIKPKQTFRQDDISSGWPDNLGHFVKTMPDDLGRFVRRIHFRRRNVNAMPQGRLGQNPR